MRPQGGAVPIIPINSGEGVSTMSIALSIPPGVLLLNPVLLTHRVVMDIQAPPETTSANIYFVPGVRSVSGVNIIYAIPRFVGGGKKDMVRKLNNFCSKIP